MNIKLEQYKVFSIAASSGSFSEAAKQLYITQSAVSQQIRSLESELGVMLFARGRKGAKLTTQGELLYGFVKRALTEIDNAENLFSRMRSLDDGSLRIGAGDTITRHYLLPKLEFFHNTYPGIKIETVNRVTNEALAQLESGKVDIAFVNLPISKAFYNHIDVRETDVLHDIFIAGNKYEHLKNKRLTMREIASLPLAMLEATSNTRRITDDYFASHDVILNPEFELGSHELLFDFAKKNLGIACVTEEFTDISERNEVFKINTDFQLPARRIGICTLKNVVPSPAVVKLIEMFE